MIALARIGRGFHLAQQRVHLFGAEAAAGAHANCDRPVSPATLSSRSFKPAGVSLFGKLVGEIAQQPVRIGLPSSAGISRTRRRRDRTFDHLAPNWQVRPPRATRRATSAGFHVDHFRHEQGLARNAVVRALRFRRS